MAKPRKREDRSSGESRVRDVTATEPVGQAARPRPRGTDSSAASSQRTSTCIRPIQPATRNTNGSPVPQRLREKRIRPCRFRLTRDSRLMEGYAFTLSKFVKSVDSSLPLTVWRYGGALSFAVPPMVETKPPLGDRRVESDDLGRSSFFYIPLLSATHFVGMLPPNL